MDFEKQGDKKYDLEERTYQFAKRVATYVRKLPKDIPNIEIGKQLMRSAGSVAANYIEANNSLGTKDKLMKLRTVRKEAKESFLWIRLSEPSDDQSAEKDWLLDETMQFIRIFGTIIQRCS